MAKLKLYLDQRRETASGMFPLRIGVTTRSAHIYITTDIRLKAEQWDSSACCVIRTPYRTPLNRTINDIVMKFQDILSRNTEIEMLDSVSLREYIDNRMNGNESESFIEYFQRFAGARKAPGTRKIYFRALDKFAKAVPESARLDIGAITYQHIKTYIQYLEQLGIGRNTIALYIRCVSAVMNDAVDMGVIKGNPASRVKYKGQETRKRAVSLDTIRNIMTRDDLEGWQAVARDMFILSFLLIGINAIDLLKAKCSDIHDGRLEYQRSKTWKLYSVNVTEEAWRIIDKYTDGEHLVRLPTNAVNYDSVINQITMSLQQIQPGLTYYVARHSWATIAYDLGVPLDVISDALGHSHGASVTGVYIKKNLTRVDDAQRMVIDALFE